MMRILLVDDDPLILESLSIILKTHSEARVVGMAQDGE